MMMYQSYQGISDWLDPSRAMARSALAMRDRFWPQADEWDFARRFHALCQTWAVSGITHVRPDFGIGPVNVGNRAYGVRERVVESLPFGDLVHFAKEGLASPQPKMLVVAPLSGHFASLLKNTVEVLLRDHDVYITDWRNARDVPLSAGRFGLEDYTDYVIGFLQALGPGANVLAVCQPCVPVLAAVAVMSARRDPCVPRTMTLMGGPIDVREAPTAVNELATAKDLEWFAANLIAQVPWRYLGAGRKVYPGFLQLSAFMAMNMGRHFGQFRKLYQHLAEAEAAEAAKITGFYSEYMAVLDLSAEFYLETIDEVFQKASLAKGELVHRGEVVDCGAIRRTAILTVEGERDDICGVGQTAAAHRLCSGLRPHLKRHHLQPGVGHYGVFSGSKWEKQIYPQVRNMVLAMA
jgi:poly(3-hydroxybutyrate) depolymerase